jgi:serine/threonine-protein kinase
VAADEDPPNERTVVERRDPLVGEVFDRRFQVEARIAAGGFGAIYRATHIKSGHEFALKVLHANLTSDPRVIARFRREGATLTRLRDPHTITAYELSEAEDGTLYIVMELLYGESLYERYRKQGRMPWQRVVAIARAVCSSLAEAHALGIIHRDLKPTNIHLEQKHGTADYVKVLDFGIAKILQGGEIDSSDLTHAGQMVGTLDYMSPEQMVGGMCTAASDIYTLGVVMYELLAGKKPFDDANSAAAALAAVLTSTPEPVSRHAPVPPHVDRLVLRCLERTSSDRFQTAQQLAGALDDLITATDEVVTTVAALTPANTTLPGGTAAPRKHVTPAPRLVSPVQSSFVETLPLPHETPPPLIRNREPTPAPKLRVREPTPQPRKRETTPAPQPRKHPPTPSPPAAIWRDAHEAPTVRREPAVPGDLDTTLADSATVVGHAPPVRVAPRIGTPATGVPHVAGPAIPSTNLREAYPAIARPAPSPMRPVPAPFDDRAAASVAVAPLAPYDTAQAALVRRIAMAVGVGIAVLVGVLLLARC